MPSDKPLTMLWATDDLMLDFNESLAFDKTLQGQSPSPRLLRLSFSAAFSLSSSYGKNLQESVKPPIDCCHFRFTCLKITGGIIGTLRAKGEKVKAGPTADMLRWPTIWRPRVFPCARSIIMSAPSCTRPMRATPRSSELILNKLKKISLLFETEVVEVSGKMDEQGQTLHVVGPILRKPADLRRSVSAQAVCWMQCALLPLFEVDEPAVERTKHQADKEEIQCPHLKLSKAIVFRASSVPAARAARGQPCLIWSNVNALNEAPRNQQLTRHLFKALLLQQSRTHSDLCKTQPLSLPPITHKEAAKSQITSDPATMLAFYTLSPLTKSSLILNHRRKQCDVAKPSHEAPHQGGKKRRVLRKWWKMARFDRARDESWSQGGVSSGDGSRVSSAAASCNLLGAAQADTSS
ncbi:hypothetical protein HJFPF1_09863 [Paramyrothecium foliicola]|nr:hypothetical protein HJFPF1_09863 [Paramyrothecium foliicola]